MVFKQQKAIMNLPDSLIPTEPSIKAQTYKIILGLLRKTGKQIMKIKVGFRKERPP